MFEEFWVWNKEDEEWESTYYHSFEGAEDFVLRNGGYEKYEIFEKLS